MGNEVVVGAGAKILGPITIGDGALVGSNAVVVRDAAPGATIVGVPGRAVDHDRHAKHEAETHFAAYGALTPDMPDPVSKAINGLLSHVSVLEARIKELETTTGQHIGEVHDGDDIDRDDQRPDF